MPHQQACPRRRRRPLEAAAARALPCPACPATLSGAAPADVTYLDVRIAEIFPRLPCEPLPGMVVVNGHTDRWPLAESPATATARAWVENAVTGR